MLQRCKKSTMLVVRLKNLEPSNIYLFIYFCNWSSQKKHPFKDCIPKFQKCHRHKSIIVSINYNNKLFNKELY